MSPSILKETGKNYCCHHHIVAIIFLPGQMILSIGITLLLFFEIKKQLRKCIYGPNSSYSTIPIFIEITTRKSLNISLVHHLLFLKREL